MKNITIAVTDDDTLITGLIEDFLNNCKGFEVLFCASDGNDLLAKLNNSNQIPDVALLDLKMTGMDGIETTRQLKVHFPTIKIIIISSHYKQSFLSFMFKTGASAFVPKGISPLLLQQIIQTVYTNSIYFMEDQVDAMKQKTSPKAAKTLLNDENELSEREIEVLKLISLQKTAKEIGEMLYITTRTVEGHKNNLFIKTGAKNIAGLVVYAIQNDIISIDQLPRI